MRRFGKEMGQGRVEGSKVHAGHWPAPGALVRSRNSEEAVPEDSV